MRRPCFAALCSVALATLAALSPAGCASAGPVRERFQELRAQRTEPQTDQAAATEALTLTHQGRERSALVQAPPTTGALRPVVVVLHGGTRSNADVFSRSDWPAIAAGAGAILVAPNAVGGNWNDGRTTYQGSFDPSGIDDAGFLMALIDRVLSSYGGDPARVYITGASNGGNMSWRLACEHGRRIAAIAPVISTMPGDAETRCADAPPMPVIAFFGTADPLMRYDGSAVRSRGGRMTEARLSASASTDWWAARNGCTLPGRTEPLPDVDTTDGTTVNRIVYACAGAPVERYDVVGGGHIAPGAPSVPGQLGRFLGPRSGDVNANALIWRFFADKHRPQ